MPVPRIRTAVLFLWNLLPDRLKASMYHRFLFPPSPQWHHLYESASLKYAPGLTMRLLPSDRMHGSIAFLGYYEREQSRRTARLGREIGGLLVDVGSNVGYHSLIWTAQSPANRAIAIEPSPTVLPLLKENITRNGFEDRITVLPIAAGDREDIVAFHTGPEDETGWGGVAKESSDETVHVKQRPLDKVVTESIQFLKIDVEGADLRVLQGARDLLSSQQVRHICFEHNLDRAKDLQIGEREPMELLSRHGYEVKRRHGDWWARSSD